jgi:hypothetical protein
LYTDSDEVFFDAMRPAILNGIDHLAERADLADRALILNLPPIEEHQRRDEAQLYGDFERNLPQILGALFTALSGTLTRLPHVHLACKPRMADLALWATAAEEPLGLNPGDFMRAYAGNRADAVQETLEADPVSSGIMALMDSFAEHGDEEFWEGTCTDLLHKLANRVDDGTQKSRSWPKSPQAMSGRLRRLATFLRESGIHITLPTKSGKGRRLLTIARRTPENVATFATHATQSSEHPTNQPFSTEMQGGDLAGQVAMNPQPKDSPPEPLSPNSLNGDEKQSVRSQVAKVAMFSANNPPGQRTDDCPRCGPVNWQRLGDALVCSNCGREAPSVGTGSQAERLVV